MVQKGRKREFSEIVCKYENHKKETETRILFPKQILGFENSLKGLEKQKIKHQTMHIVKGSSKEGKENPQCITVANLLELFFLSC